MKLVSVAFPALLPLVACAQCDPGLPFGHGVNHCYDDGYVRVDSSGNADGATWYWGYQASSQIQSGLIVFHSRTNLDANTVQLLTDTFDLGGLVPPPAPYAGTSLGPGPLISDIPVSRSIAILITPPVLSIKSTATNSIVVSWPSSSTNWTLQANASLNTTNWTDVLTVPVDDGTNKTVIVWPLVGNKVYRLRKS